MELLENLGRQGMDDLGKQLQHNIKSLIGVTCEVHVVEEGKVERTLVGKAKRVIDKRPK
jgi:phenylacetate-CoA ligase